jgi:hypothetical protein
MFVLHGDAIPKKFYECQAKIRRTIRIAISVFIFGEKSVEQDRKGAIIWEGGKSVESGSIFGSSTVLVLFLAKEKVAGPNSNKNGIGAYRRRCREERDCPAIAGGAITALVQFVSDPFKPHRRPLCSC